MKSFLLILSFSCLAIVGNGQNAAPVNLELNKVQDIDNQFIDTPASLTGEVESVKTINSAANQRSVINTGPLSPQAIPVNDNCANAITLTVDAPCVNGTNKESTVQAGENTACQGAITKSVWYRFVATNASMYVEVERTASSGCYLSSAVYSGACLPSASLSCEDAAFGPNLNIHNLTGLTVGATYYVQVSYTAGTVCGNNNNANTGADFCIKVGRPVICGTCASPCGPICVFATTPTVAQVTSTCTRYDLVSRLNAGQTRSQCYTFTAVAATFSLQMIINTVGCSGGNVTAFDWQLYPSNCSGIVQSGNLSNLNATGLTIGAPYVICYTWTAACQHNSVYPYIVATSPLPIELLHFGGDVEQKNIRLKWVTASETNNKQFSVQRSKNGIDFTEIGTVAGAGNSNNPINYFFNDNNPDPGVNYYRLVQYDYDHTSSSSNVIALRFKQKYSFNIDRNPVSDVLTLSFNSEEKTTVKINIVNQYGQVVYLHSYEINEGNQLHSIPVESLASGVYHLNVEGISQSSRLKFIKM